MIWTILFLAGLAITGGLAALLGDGLGRKLGKKRVTIGRMRPKHFAMWGTFIFGMLGTALVVGVLLLVSEPIRQALFRYQGVVKDLKTAQGSLHQTQAQRDQVLAQNQQIQTQLQAATTELGTKQADVTKAQADATQAQQQAKDAEAKAESIQSKIGETSTKLKETQSRLDKAKVDVDEQKKLVDKAKADQVSISKDNSELIAKNGELTQRTTELGDSLKTLENDRTRLTAENARLSEEKDKLKMANAAALAEYDAKITENEQKIADQKRQIDNQLRQISAVQKELDAASVELTLTSNTSRNFPLVFSAGDELARHSVSVHGSVADAQRAVNALVDEASRTVRERNNGDSTRVARLIFLGKDGKVEEPQLGLDQLVQKIISSDEDTVLVARAIVNSFKTEHALISVMAFKNPVVYSAGQLIAEGHIDGSKNEFQIFNDVASLINGPVKNQAIQGGMIPATGQDAPLGQVTTDQILAIVSEMKNYGRTGRVQFIAAKQTRRGDRLNLTYRLRP